MGLHPPETNQNASENTPFAPQKKEVKHLPVPIDFHDTMLLSFRDGFLLLGWDFFGNQFILLKSSGSQVKSIFVVQSFSGSQVNFFWVPPDSVGSETGSRETRKHIPPKTGSQKIIDSKVPAGKGGYIC